jgi:hypothetical protein
LEEGEAIRLLEQQRGLLSVGTGSDGEAQGTEPPICGNGNLPETLVAHYRELLRTYVVMGSGNLSDEMRVLAQALVTHRVPAADAMQLHLIVSGDMIRSLGSRSARHVVNRANLMIMELIIGLADGYREQEQEYGLTCRQRGPGLGFTA